jgi:heptosyltransferase-3
MRARNRSSAHPGASAGRVDLSGQLTLRELAALTARARLFFGVDSAPMHIAAAMGTPVVALFGPSDEHAWGPWRVRAPRGDARLPVPPVQQRRLRRRQGERMPHAPSVERVHSAINELLAAGRGS